MDNQYNHQFTTSASSLFDSQPQQVKDLLKGLHQGSSKLFNKNTQPAFLQEENMAQWHYGGEIATSRTQSHVDHFSSTGTSADSMYGSKAYKANKYQGSETYSQSEFHNAPYRETGIDTGGQGYGESSSEMGQGPAGQRYYDRTSFQGATYNQGYESGMLGGGSWTGGHGCNDGSSRGKGRGYMGQGSNVNTRGKGRGTWGPRSFGSARGRGQGSIGRETDRSIEGKGRGTGGQGSRGRGSDWSVQRKGRGTGGQGLDAGTRGGTQGRGRGRGTRGRGFDGNAIHGRGSAKRGMPDRGYGNGPAAKKPKWQNEQQGTGNVEHRWGAEQGWARERIWRGKGKEQRGRGGRGRGDRGRHGGLPQRNNPSHQKYDGDAVEYGFDGKPVGPERYARNYGEYTHCKVCDVHINSTTCAKAHYSGKIHQKKLNAILQKEELMKTVDLSAGKCELCDVVYTTPAQVKSHLEGGRHKRNLEEAKAKAEGRPLPTDSTDQKKQEGGNETVAAVGMEKTASGEKSSNEYSALDNSQQVVEPVPQARGKISCGDSKPYDSAKKHSEGPPSKQNVGEGDENMKSKKGKRKLTSAEKEAGGKPQLFHCDLCGISTTSPEALAAHFVGKKHKQRMEFVERQNSMCTATTANVYSCELCGIRATDSYSLNLHLIGKKHMKNLELSKGAQTKQLEPLMASTSQPPNRQEPPLPEPINKPPLPPLPPPNEEPFEIEAGLKEEFLLEGGGIPQKSQDDISSAIVQSLQETTADMPKLNF